MKFSGNLNHNKRITLVVAALAMSGLVAAGISTYAAGGEPAKTGQTKSIVNLTKK